MIGKRLTVAVLASALAAGGLAAVTVTTASAGQNTRVIANCTKAVYKPTHFVFFCADAGAGLRHATYTSWHAQSAHGSGVYYYNDCKPTCAGGTIHHEAGTFRLYRVEQTSNHGPLFTRIEVVTKKHDKRFDLPTKTISDY